jgi:hypothetical protein
VARREDLEELARSQAELLVEHLVGRSESVDYRQGTYLLAALAAELGAHVQHRCWELARAGEPAWEVVANDTETLINAAWRSMAAIWAESEQEDRRLRQHQERIEREERLRREREARDARRRGGGDESGAGA